MKHRLSIRVRLTEQIHKSGTTLGLRFGQCPTLQALPQCLDDAASGFAQREANTISIDTAYQRTVWLRLAVGPLKIVILAFDGDDFEE